METKAAMPNPAIVTSMRSTKSCHGCGGCMRYSRTRPYCKDDRCLCDALDRSGRFAVHVISYGAAQTRPPCHQLSTPSKGRTHIPMVQLRPLASSYGGICKSRTAVGSSAANEWMFANSGRSTKVGDSTVNVVLAHDLAGSGRSEVSEGGPPPSAYASCSRDAPAHGGTHHKTKALPLLPLRLAAHSGTSGAMWGNFGCGTHCRGRLHWVPAPSSRTTTCGARRRAPWRRLTCADDRAAAARRPRERGRARARSPHSCGWSECK
eukprot:scaffold85703_cov32-Tisochrysis_lutea.AAC.1